MEHPVGIVRAINSRRGRVAVEVDGYGFTVFDTDEWGELQIGDELVGDLRTHGDAMLRNRTHGGAVEVYIEAHDATPANARTLLQ